VCPTHKKSILTLLNLSMRTDSTQMLLTTYCDLFVPTTLTNLNIVKLNTQITCIIHYHHYIFNPPWQKMCVETKHKVSNLTISSVHTARRNSQYDFLILLQLAICHIDKYNFSGAQHQQFQILLCLNDKRKN
jgi:hypothetical protein